MKSNWEFKSTWEQREACREKWNRKEPYATEEEAKEAAKDFNYFWRGTGTEHKPVPKEGGWILQQGLIGE